MGEIKIPNNVKLIVGMISCSVNIFKNAEKKLKLKFGKIDFESEVLPFNHTDYYKKEFGENLLRKFLSFEKLIKPDELYNIKIFTNKLEKKTSIENKRRINLDPGYISLSKLILASTKDYYHRIYIKSGIYAEVTLHYKNKTFNSFQWTYPDYKTKEYIEIFNKIREIYHNQIKQH
jgi:hypothetical protein